MRRADTAHGTMKVSPQHMSVQGHRDLPHPYLRIRTERLCIFEHAQIVSTFSRGIAKLSVYFPRGKNAPTDPVSVYVRVVY